jgi:hypothetical protein
MALDLDKALTAAGIDTQEKLDAWIVRLKPQSDLDAVDLKISVIRNEAQATYDSALEAALPAKALLAATRDEAERTARQAYQNGLAAIDAPIETAYRDAIAKAADLLAERERIAAEQAAAAKAELPIAAAAGG